MRYVTPLWAAIALILSTTAQAVTIQIDYSYDWNGFFSSQASRDDMQRAAATMGAFLSDHLDAITPGNGNSWDSEVFDPTFGGSDSIPDLAVPADTMIVYVGGRNLGGSTLAQTYLGTANEVTGSADFVDAVNNRGQGVTGGPTANDFGPWGASISFSNQYNWSFSSGLPAAGTYDFYSVALHELEHALGFGTSDSFVRQVSGQTFVGPASVAENGGPVSLAGDSKHWAPGTTSDGMDAVMNSTIAAGVRRLDTPLDLAALSDIGWQVNTGLLSTGDLNFDGFVDIQDLTLLANTWLSTNLAGDANHDGRVDIQDLTLIANHWLEHVGPGAILSSPAPVPVPEPSTLALAGCGVVAWIACRRPFASRS